MDSENMKCNSKEEIFHNKCKFCGKDLKPIGLDYLYANMPLSSIEYERCDCKQAKDYWNEIDLKEEKQKKRKQFEQMIRQFYIQNYISKQIQDYQFDNFIITETNKKEVEIAKDFIEKCINKNQKNGLIITGKSGVGKTHLATAFLNKLTEKDMLVLMGRLILLLDVIKDTFKDFSSREKDIIELYSKVDMLIIDDLGTERISNWALEKLYTIIENRNENKLPIIVTTRFNKETLLDRFLQSEDKELSEAVIQKLYQFCYGIELKKYDQNEKEKVSISDQTKY
ncbi:MAG TPA: ATP-binding protein [Clostridiaceae bacterium]|nr:ATP-binding protein [Clostridiaceae bacterium]